MKIIQPLRNIAIILICITAGAWMPSAGQSAPNQKDLSSTALGRLVSAYFDVYNTGDAAHVRQFFVDHFSRATMPLEAIDARLQMYGQVFQENGKREIHRVDLVSDTAVKVTASTASGEWLQMTFRGEAGPTALLVSMTAEMVPPPSGSVAGEPISLEQALKQIDAIIDSLQQKDQFSGSVLIAQGGKPLYSKAVGYASIENQVPNRVDTKFNLGSINKIFTKVAIGQLAQQGKIKFDIPIGKYLPDYPNKDAANKVTIQHLLDMSSGIGDFFGKEFSDAAKDRFRSNSSFLPLFASKPLKFEPGTRQEYSNGGFIVLGAIVEKVSGEDYHAYIRRHVFEPAGMTNSESYAADDIVPNLAMGYTAEGENGTAAGQRHQNIYSRPARGSAAGGGYSTAEDMVKFGESLREGKLLDGRYTVWMLTRELPAAEPTDLSEAIGSGRLGIAGGSLGINADFSLDCSSGLAVAVMANYDPPAAENLARAIHGLLARVTLEGRSKG